MGTLRGYIRLANRQAEGRRMEIAALCLSYWAVAAICAGLTVWRLHIPDGALRPLTAAGAVIAGVCAVCLRTVMRYRVFRVGDDYLRMKRRGVCPGRVPLLGFGAGYAAAVCSAVLLCVTPAFCCFAAGAHYYIRSGRRGLTLLLVGASALLLAGGVVAAAVVAARWSCAEYFFFSGRCGGTAAALDASWTATREEAGRMLLLAGLAAVCGWGVASLSGFAFARRLVEQNRESPPG